jgi:hypothetical protein
MHQGCKLLMWLYGYDIHFLRVRLAKPEYSSAANMNDDRIIIYPEYWRATDKSVKFWGIEANISDKRCRQPAELRGIDPGDKFLQVFVHPYEPKNRESGEDTANWREWMSALRSG